MALTGLHTFLVQAAEHYSARTAIVDPTHGRQITYRELNYMSNQLRDRLCHLGVGSGDRIGIYVRKSIDTIASIFGILKAGAAYVPVDPTAPAARNVYVFRDCSVKAIILEQQFVGSLVKEFKNTGAVPHLLKLEPTSTHLPLQACLDRANEDDPAPLADTAVLAPDDLAYILYTSGSTGNPKGVCVSHNNAASFVNWCSNTFTPHEDDRFSSHAPFHFDLSIFDLFVSIKHGATLFLIGEDLGKNPTGMMKLIADERLTIWYSTPSVLTLLISYGKLECYNNLSLRLVLFAGEVFPVKHLRHLKAILPKPRYFNLYGPTETNVCTYYEIPATIPEDRSEPYPIGTVCSHLRARVSDEQGQSVARGEEGELYISGPSVMQGYWQLPLRTAAAFHANGPDRWYKTGDIVIEQEGGIYTFVGRRDRMVKRRGYRIELGEIEAALYQHPEVSEAAAVALSNDEGILIKCFYSTCDGNSLSLIHLKQFCAENLPLYMIPDQFFFQIKLPKTSTDKIDYQQLQEVG
jgi:amino acid adenylation domain-containing protein